MFSERLIKIIADLGTHNGVIAGYAKLDRSSISRLRSGSRWVAPDSDPVKKTVHGIVGYAEAEKKKEKLLQIIGSDADLSGEELENAVIVWLYEGEDAPVKEEAKKHIIKKRREAGTKYGSRLDRVMKLVGLSNIYVCEKAAVDPGTMSRYRSGQRFPKYGNRISKDITAVIWERIIADGWKGSIAELLDFPEDILDEEYFYRWLCDYDEKYTESSKDVEKLLSAFDSYTQNKIPPLPDISEFVPASAYKTKKKIYKGHKGLQEAVIRFLANAIKNNSPELLLYSDEGMEWMMDKKFAPKWASLMLTCIKSGTRIRIIHNIERDLTEMNEAIISWLPLYISGMIEPYYSKRAGGERFSHTLFIDPKCGCIEACHVRGTEADGVYEYHTAVVDISRYKKHFEHMLGDCDMLIRFVHGADDGYGEAGTKSYNIPFSNIHSLRIGNDHVSLVRTKEPIGSVIFTHPLMCRAFRVYVSSCQQKEN